MVLITFRTRRTKNISGLYPIHHAVTKAIFKKTVICSCHPQFATLWWFTITLRIKSRPFTQPVISLAWTLCHQPISFHTHLILSSLTKLLFFPIILLFPLPVPLFLSIFNFLSSFISQFKCHLLWEASSDLPNLFKCPMFSQKQYRAFLTLISWLFHKY